MAGKAGNSRAASVPFLDIVRVLKYAGMPEEEALKTAREQGGETPYIAIIHAVRAPTNGAAARAVEAQESCVELPETRAVRRFNDLINSLSRDSQQDALNQVYGDYLPVDCKRYLDIARAEMEPTGEPLLPVPSGKYAIQALDRQQTPQQKEPGLLERWLSKY